MGSSTQIGHPVAREESYVSLGTTVGIPNINNSPWRREAGNQRIEGLEGEEAWRIVFKAGSSLLCFTVKISDFWEDSSSIAQEVRQGRAQR